MKNIIIGTIMQAFIASAIIHIPFVFFDIYIPVWIEIVGNIVLLIISYFFTRYIYDN